MKPDEQMPRSFGYSTEKGLWAGEKEIPAPREVSDARRWPTVEQLAQIAATLALRKSASRTQPQKLASEAIELWFACGQTITTRWLEGIASDERMRATPISRPDSYPVELDDVLRLALPKRRLNERELILRGFLRNKVNLYGICDWLPMPADYESPASDEEIEKGIYFLRNRKFDKHQFDTATHVIWSFEKNEYTPANLSQRGRAGGLAKVIASGEKKKPREK